LPDLQTRKKNDSCRDSGRRILLRLKTREQRLPKGEHDFDPGHGFHSHQEGMIGALQESATSRKFGETE